ncbi:hypothetical protein MNV49_005996 [Pseudohyphozyma bogoriensis]|nr:hypothetical protein MNV49_005996 [Pseudohyphozyma bogoriensis]
MASDPKQETAVYTHGHHASVLRSHSWRTVENSAGFLIPYLKDGISLLDCGCGPGTITADFAERIGPSGKVTGLEYAEKVLVEAKASAAKKGVTNVEFVVGDIHNLPFEDNTFDVVFAHQVLQHVGTPIQALREMRRVCKVGGVVAVRDSDYSSFSWFPMLPGLDTWQALYQAIAKHNGGEPNAGRYLTSWARQAGYKRSEVKATASTWCYYSEDEIAWWSDLWAERTLKSAFCTTSLEAKLATMEDLEAISRTWREWGQEEDAWFTLFHGEILCTKE